MACWSGVVATTALSTLLASTQCFRTRRHPTGKTIAGVSVSNYREGAEDWILLFRQGTSDEALHSMCRGRCAFEGHPDKGGAPFAVVYGTMQLEELLSENKESVELLEPDAVDYAIPELEVEENQEDSRSTASWGLERVGVPERPSTGKGVHVYVQDTGVRVSHTDFGGRAIPTLDLTSGSLKECKGDRSCAQDKAGHGTHCAGTVGGTSYGVASEVAIHAVKTLGDSGSGQRVWNIMAIDWITTQGAKPTVISLSLGGLGQDQAYKKSIDAATAAGVTVVVAAGNFGSDTCTYSPAFVPSAITVGATDAGDKRASYSNFGSCNDIMAPGTAITSASHTMDWYTAKLTGTSMACPHVSGAAALLLELNPSWKRSDIFAHMEDFGRVGFVKGLKTGDPDLFLWVGKDAAPGEPECPAFAQSAEPNYWGDCRCQGTQFCSKDGKNANCPTSAGVGGWGGNFFSWTCKECKCF